METGYIFKEFFDRTIDTKNYESRSDNRFINTSKRENYLFNSSINGIEEADLIFIAGANPRYEATILNARIRKAYLNNNPKIISLNDLGDLTYPYQSLDGKTQTIKDIIENKNNISKDLLNSKKPMIIFGESFLNLKSSNYLFFGFKEYLLKNNKFADNWNPLNLLRIPLLNKKTLFPKCLPTGQPSGTPTGSNIYVLRVRDHLHQMKSFYTYVFPKCNALQPKL